MESLKSCTNETYVQNRNRGTDVKIKKNRRDKLGDWDCHKHTTIQKPHN